MNQNQALSVIVPTLNEEGNVQKLVARIHKTLATAKIPYEIVFIDDHSTDKTVPRVQALKKRYPFLNLRVQAKRGKRGKAFSLLQGFRAARYPLVCMIDADLQYPPEAISAMYHKLNRESADIVVTERVDQKTSRVRQLSTKVFHLIFTRMLFGLSFDSQSGLKLFKKRVLSTIKLNPSQWSFDLEFLVRSRDKNYKIVNHKIAFSERFAGEAKVNVIATTYELAKASIKLWLQGSDSKQTSRFRLSGQHSIVSGLIFGGASLMLLTPSAGSAIANQSYMLGNIAATSRYRSYNERSTPASYAKRSSNYAAERQAPKPPEEPTASNTARQRQSQATTMTDSQTHQSLSSNTQAPRPASTTPASTLSMAPPAAQPAPQPRQYTAPVTSTSAVATSPQTPAAPSSIPAQLPVHGNTQAEEQDPHIQQVAPVRALSYNALNQLGLFSMATGGGAAAILAIKQYLLR